MLNVLKTIWKPVEKALRFVGKVQSAILLTVFYLIILAPIGIIFKIIKIFKPQLKVSSYWKKRPEIMETEETLLRQF